MADKQVGQSKAAFLDTTTKVSSAAFLRIRGPDKHDKCAVNALHIQTGAMQHLRCIPYVTEGGEYSRVLGHG